jgi:glycosyltransferase involved in cell wall biosynthesis
MIVGYDAKRIAVNRVGLGNYGRTLIRQLATTAPSNEYHLYSPVPFDRELFDPSGLPSVRLHAPASKPNMLRQHQLRYRHVAKQAVEDRLDLYHGLSHALPPRMPCPTVVTMHDLIVMRHPEFYPAIDRWSYTRTIKQAVARADLILSVSEATKADLSELLAIPSERIVVTWQACDERFRCAVPQESLDRTRSKYGLPQRFVLSLGTIERRKNAVSLVRGFARVANELEDVGLVFAGKGTRYLEEVQQAVVATGLRNRTFFLGFTATEDLPALYRLASLFAYLPLIEGFGIPVLEAMQCGTPSITSNRSSLREIGGEEASVLVDPQSEESIAEGLYRALRDDSAHQKLRAALPGRTQQFSPETVCRRVLEAYKQVL